MTHTTTRLPLLALGFTFALLGAACENRVPIGDSLVEEGPCARVVCDSPPVATCEGNERRVFQGPGTCADGQCHYESTLQPCALGCQAGSCLDEAEACVGISCNQPPPASCLDAQTLRTWGIHGTCAGGQCSYAPRDLPCALGCANGACVDEACAGVSCNQPPASSCSSPTSLTTYPSPGTCSNGTCQYAPAETTCPFGCLNGACVNDPCTGVSCNQPPAAYCLNPTTRRGWTTPGSCAGGSCTYAPVDTTCPFGCLNGSCNNDPCAGVSCTTPPAAYCLDAQTRRGWSNPGSCAGGSCSYAPVDTPCAFGCLNGSCNNDPCAGITCNSPPSACHQSTGTCTNGTCSYAFNDGAACNDNDSCTVNDLCQSGVCAGAAKTCTTPPPNTCSGPNALRTYQATGACSPQGCQYPYAEVSCAFGCAAGACLPDPCLGVSCNAPPAATCTNANTLRVFGAGSCQSGSCSYSFVDQPCPNGCANGACTAPSCGGTTCNTPPLATCVSSTTLERYAPMGTCDGSTCKYQKITVECGNGCINGACLPGWERETFPFAPPSSACFEGSCFMPHQLAVRGGLIHIVGINLTAQGHILYRVRDGFGWTEELVDPGMGASAEAVLTLDGSGTPFIAYYDSNNKHVRLARKVGSQWVKELVVNNGLGGQGVSLTFDAQGAPAVSFAEGNKVKLARKSGNAWTVEEVGPWAGGKTTVRLNPAGSLEVVALGMHAVRGGSGWTATAVPNYPLANRPLGFAEDGSSRIAASGRMYFLQGGKLEEELITSSPPFSLAMLDAPRRAKVFPFERTDSGAWVFWTSPNLPYGSHGSSYLDAQYGSDGRLYLLGIGGVMVSAPCAPQCGGRSCGNDGCGGSCGTCGAGLQCSADGACTAYGFRNFYAYKPTQSNTSFGDFSLAGEANKIHFLEQRNHLYQENGSWLSTYSSIASIFSVARYVGPPVITTFAEIQQWNGGGWSSLANPGQSLSGDPVSSAVDGSGKVHVLMSRCSSGVQQLKYFRSDAPNTLQSVGPTSAACYSIRVGGVAAGGSKVYLVYSYGPPPQPGQTTVNRPLIVETLTANGFVQEQLDANRLTTPGEQAVDAAGKLHLLYSSWDNQTGGWVYAAQGPSGWIQEPLPAGFTPKKLRFRTGKPVSLFESDSDGTLHVAERQGPGQWAMERVGKDVNAEDLFVDEAGGSHVLFHELIYYDNTRLLRYGYKP